MFASSRSRFHQRFLLSSALNLFWKRRSSNRACKHHHTLAVPPTLINSLTMPWVSAWYYVAPNAANGMSELLQSWPTAFEINLTTKHMQYRSQFILHLLAFEQTFEVNDPPGVSWESVALELKSGTKKNCTVMANLRRDQSEEEVNACRIEVKSFSVYIAFQQQFDKSLNSYRSDTCLEHKWISWFLHWYQSFRRRLMVTRLNEESTVNGPNQWQEILVNDLC